MNRQEYLTALRAVYTRNKEAGIRDMLASGANYLNSGFNKMVDLGRQGLDNLHGWWHYLKEDPKTQRRLKVIRKASKTLNDEFKILTQNDIDRADAGIAAIDGLDRTYHAIDSDTEMKSGVKSVLDAAKDIARTGNIKKYLKKGVNKGHDAIKARYPSIQDTEDAVNILLNGPEKKSNYSLGGGIAKILLKQAMYKSAGGPDDLPRDSSGSTVLDRQRYSYWNPTHPENQTRQNMNHEYGVPIGEYKEPETPEWIKAILPYAERRKEFLTTDGKEIDRDKLWKSNGDPIQSVVDSYWNEPWYRRNHGIKNPLYSWFNTGKGYGVLMDLARMVGDNDEFATEDAINSKSPLTSQMWPSIGQAWRGPYFFADVALAGEKQRQLDERRKELDARVSEARKDQARDLLRATLEEDPTYIDRLRQERIRDNIAAKQMVATERALAGSNPVEKQLGIVPEGEPEFIFSDTPKTAYDPIAIPAAQEPKIELDPTMVAPIQLPENYEERAIVDAPDRPYDMTIAKHP